MISGKSCLSRRPRRKCFDYDEIVRQSAPRANQKDQNPMQPMQPKRYVLRININEILQYTAPTDDQPSAYWHDQPGACAQVKSRALLTPWLSPRQRKNAIKCAVCTRPFVKVFFKVSIPKADMSACEQDKCDEWLHRCLCASLPPSFLF